MPGFWFFTDVHFGRNQSSFSKWVPGCLRFLWGHTGTTMMEQGAQLKGYGKAVSTVAQVSGSSPLLSLFLSFGMDGGVPFSACSMRYNSAAMTNAVGSCVSLFNSCL